MEEIILAQHLHSVNLYVNSGIKILQDRVEQYNQARTRVYIQLFSRKTIPAEF